jgi:uncharacterized protein with PIN domain
MVEIKMKGVISHDRSWYCSKNVLRLVLEPVTQQNFWFSRSQGLHSLCSRCELCSLHLLVVKAGNVKVLIDCSFVMIQVSRLVVCSSPGRRR